jgi:hypothetical protein
MMDYIQLIMIIGSSLAGLIIIKNICYRCADTIDNFIYFKNNSENNEGIENNNYNTNYDTDIEYDTDSSNYYEESTDLEAPDAPDITELPRTSDTNNIN